MEKNIIKMEIYIVFELCVLYYIEFNCPDMVHSIENEENIHHSAEIMLYFDRFGVERTMQSQELQTFELSPQSKTMFWFGFVCFSHPSETWVISSSHSEINYFWWCSGDHRNPLSRTCAGKLLTHWAIAIIPVCLIFFGGWGHLAVFKVYFCLYI